MFGVVPCPGCAGVAGVSAGVGRTADDVPVWSLGAHLRIHLQKIRSKECNTSRAKMCSYHSKYPQFSIWMIPITHH